MTNPITEILTFDDYFSMFLKNHGAAAAMVQRLKARMIEAVETPHNDLAGEIDDLADALFEAVGGVEPARQQLEDLLEKQADLLVKVQDGAFKMGLDFGATLYRLEAETAQ